MGKTTNPPIRSKEGARRSQPRSARCFTRRSPERDTYAGSWTARHSEERALLHEVVAPARHVRWLMDGSSQQQRALLHEVVASARKVRRAHGRLVAARNARCFTGG